MKSLRVVGAASLVCALALSIGHRDRGPTESPRPGPVPTASASASSEAANVVLHDFSTARATSSPEVAAADGEAVYFTDRVLVTIDAGIVDEVAQRHGLEVLRVSADLGMARLAVPADRDVQQVIEALSADSMVASAFAAGRMVGAGSKGGETATAADLQWHLAASGIYDPPTADDIDDYSDFTVAVLDSGVAYESHADDKGTYLRAPSLADTEVVAPRDFVNQDDHANDDHQHGTHIASVILSNGAVLGAAPGAALMPVKVLDENNHGDELALIEGLHHAVDNGADVINMSLSFGHGFVPSAEMLLALDRAEKAGIVMVASAGNAGADEVSWPAASPGVIAVGAFAPRDKQSVPVAASYSNLGAVDVMGPGGDQGVDRNNDGYDDGILAESFAPNDPTSIGYWFQAGTSQAAAFVSGSAVQLLAAGAAPDEVRAALHVGSSTNFLGVQPFQGGMGAGVLNVEEAMTMYTSRGVPRVDGLFVSVMPYIARAGEEMQPWSRFVVVDRDGEPAAGVRVHAQARGSTRGRLDCVTSSEGMCEVMAERVYGSADIPVLWAWSVETLEVQGIGSPPSGVMFASDQLEVLLAAIEDNPELRGGILAVHWPAGDHPELGQLAESYTIPDHGTGLLSSPLGLVFTPNALGQHTLTSESADLDGAGLLSSPLGLLSMRVLSLQGSGLSASALSMLGGDVQLVAADGSGLLSSPLGFSPMSMFQPMASMGGSGLLSSPLGFSGEPIFLNGGVGTNSSFSGSSIGDILGEGGWTVDGGLPAATAVFGSGLVDDPVVDEMPLTASATLPGSAFTAETEEAPEPAPTPEPEATPEDSASTSNDGGSWWSWR